MLQFFEHQLDENTIIDIVVPPGIDIDNLISNIQQPYNHMIILDTVGNLFEKYKNILCTRKKTQEDINTINAFGNQTFSELKIDYLFIHSYIDLINKLEDLKSYKGFVLIIDSVSFVCDISPKRIRAFNNLLWTLIYKCNSTVVSINHYRIEGKDKIFKLIPRMGDYWYKRVSYRLSTKQTNPPFSWEINENILEEY